MPRLSHLLPVCLLILTGTFVLLASTDDSRQWLTLDTPTRFELDGISPQFFYYAGTEGETVTITMTSLSNIEDALNNPILEIWDVRGKRLAYNDDRRHDDRNAQLSHIRLLDDGDYVIRADTYGGIYAGAFEIIIRQSDPFGKIDIPNGWDFHLPPYSIFTHTLRLQAGDIITISAQDLSNTLDPLLWITAPDGRRIAQNDDHTSTDLALGVLDAQIADLNIITTGDYTIHVRDFLGRNGRVRLTWIMR
ncbi:MAG: hypothetical protein CUN52_00055 [Phototrophicales bacterium]|nr:MAG: hypothetical protein CUN52_00055 [Phototrophicales bacterium]